MSLQLLRVALQPWCALTAALSACTPPTSPPGADTMTAATSRSELHALDRLQGAGWDCQQRGPTFISCAPPGVGLPPILPTEETRLPVYQLAVFTLDGTHLGSAHFLRADLYQGQTCAFTGAPFVLRAIIGYYECFKPVD